MAVTPSELVFNYKKGGALPPGRVVELDYSYTFVHPNEIKVKNLNDWLHVAQDANDETLVTVSLWGSNVKYLSVGTHSLDITFYNTYQDKHYELGHPDAKIISDPIGTLTVTVNVTEDVLTILPENLIFDYELGGDTVPSQNISITSDTDWTADFSNCNWIPLDTESGTAVTNQNLDIEVITAGLSVGQHIASIPFTNEGAVKNLGITLNVFSGNNDYIYATPKELNFGYTLSAVLPPTKRIELYASASWTATSIAPWILLSTDSGVEGVGFLDIGLKNVENLAVGIYSETVTLKVGDVTEIITVNLEVYKFAEELLKENTLYFSDDENNITVSSGRKDVYLSIETAANFNSELFNYKAGVPFFKGYANKRIGLIANKIINNEPVIYLDKVALFTPYAPARLSLNIKESAIYSSDVSTDISLKNMPFLKGITPDDNWISDNTKEMYLTAKGVVSFTFLNPNLASITEITLAGAVNKTFTFSGGADYLCSATIPLSLLNLKEGDAFTITVHNTVITIFIKPEEQATVLVFWRNKWSCYDAIELTGDFTEKDNYKSVNFSCRKDHLTTETKVLSVVNKTTFKLNTGALYDAQSVEVVSKMLKSKDIRLLFNNQIVKVKSNTKTLSRPKVSENTRSFNLTFEKLLKC
ncbi:hypothetical protein [Tenacibaculum dicentrarchi]|uniref:hypothetical protein n=1 Tax=Tenacibaculum dicentrarchi TaxID=669041 RepID=UPI00351633ED